MSKSLLKSLLRNEDAPTKEERRAAWDAMTPRQRREAERAKDAVAMYEPGYNSATVERAQERMMRVDQFPADVRQAVHEYGLEIVQEFWNHGIRTGRSIAHLVETVRGEKHLSGQPRFKLNKGPNAKSTSVPVRRR